MTARTWKPTPAECKLIRDAGRREAGAARFLMEVGLRFNCDTPERESGYAMNLARVSDDPDWADTDLAGFEPWAAFRKGVLLTDDGRAIVDFYVSTPATRWEDSELRGNVTVTYAAGRIERIQGVGPHSLYYQA